MTKKEKHMKLEVSSNENLSFNDVLIKACLAIGKSALGLTMNV